MKSSGNRKQLHGECCQQPTWGVRMKPLLNIGTATSALKWSIICGLHKLLMFFGLFLFFFFFTILTKNTFIFIPIISRFVFFFYQHLPNFCTVGFLCASSPTVAAFSLKGLHCVRSSAVHRPGL